MWETKGAPIDGVYFLYKEEAKFTTKELGVKRTEVWGKWRLKNIVVKKGFMKNKITAKFPDNIERPVEGHKCKLNSSINYSLCFFHKCLVVGCRNWNGRVKKKILSDQVLPQGRNKSFKGHARGDWNDGSRNLCWKGREVKTESGWKVKGQQIGNSSEVKSQMK